MKKVLVMSFLGLICTSSLYSQNKIDEVKLSDGKTIIIYSDYSWKYKESPTSNSASLYNTLPSESTKSSIRTSASTKTSTTKSTTKSNNSGICGAPTKKGGACQRRVSGGGRCWQHR